MKALILLSFFLITGVQQRLHATDHFNRPEADSSFLMAVEDAFFVSGSGIVVTGVIESGSVTPGMRVEIKGGGDKVFTATIGFISMYTKQVPSAKKGDAVGLNLRGVEKEDIKRGMVVAAPNSLQVATLIEISITLLPADKGGISGTLKNEQLLQLLSRTETTSATVLTETDLLAGQSGTIELKLFTPTAFRLHDAIALKYLGKIIAHGVVTKIE